jgi:hypothetical protein
LSIGERFLSLHRTMRHINKKAKVSFSHRLWIECFSSPSKLSSVSSLTQKSSVEEKKNSFQRQKSVNASVMSKIAKLQFQDEDLSVVSHYMCPCAAYSKLTPVSFAYLSSVCRS